MRLLALFVLFLALASQASAAQNIKMTQEQYNAALVTMHFSETRISLNQKKAYFYPSSGFARLGMAPQEISLVTDILDPTAVMNDMNTSTISARLGDDRIYFEMAFEEADVEIKSFLGTVEIEKPMVRYEIVLKAVGNQKVFSPVSSVFSGNVVPSGFFGFAEDYVKNKVLELANKNTEKHLKAIFDAPETQTSFLKGLALWAEFATGNADLQVDPASIEIKNGNLEYTVF